MSTDEERVMLGNPSWGRTWCCGMPYPTGVTLNAELLRHPSGPVAHRLTSYCVTHTAHVLAGGGLADCLTCGDTGLVIREGDGRTSLCPSHCQWAWHRLERAMR